MGDSQVSRHKDVDRLRAFMRSLLSDVKALELMIEQGLFLEGVRTIGAEQEVFLIDNAGRASPTAIPILAELTDDPRFVTEIAKFNLEANLNPRAFQGDCLDQMERELRGLLSRIDQAAGRNGARVTLTGILPTIEQKELHLGNMIPNPRYEALNAVVTEMIGGTYRLRLKGLDELEVSHDNIMVEAVNTSFQIHYQVGPREFARHYNLAQAVTGPVLAAAVNSPVLFGKRLWHESRVAVFQQSIDARSRGQQMRGDRARVDFGSAWLKDSVLEIFREDIARFRVVLGADCPEDSLKTLSEGRIPSLKALRTHNGTVYRWNRPCYGISDDGRPHLRIEARAFPAGPTVLDEMANAALFFGLLAGMSREFEDITKHLSFDDARENFFSAARSGLSAQMTWFDGRTLPAADLLLTELIPRARFGLEGAGLQSADIDRYLGTVEDRVKSGRTGSWWSLRSLQKMGSEGHPSQRLRALVLGAVRRQESERAVHTWPLATLDEVQDWQSNYRFVGQYMSTDVFTVRPWDPVDLVACVMAWQRVRHVPVEDDDGHVVGLVSHRGIIRLMAEGVGRSEREAIAVAAVMRENPVVCYPETPTLDAINLMRRHRVGSLPVVASDTNKLVGIVTEHDLIDVAAKLFEESLRAGQLGAMSEASLPVATDRSAVCGAEAILEREVQGEGIQPLTHPSAEAGTIGS